jgi:hypothetical protein
MMTVLNEQITLATHTGEDGNLMVNTTTHLTQTRMRVAQITERRNRSAESQVQMPMRKCPNHPRPIRGVLEYLNLIAGAGGNETPRTTHDLSACTLPKIIHFTYAPQLQRVYGICTTLGQIPLSGDMQEYKWHDQEGRMKTFSDAPWVAPGPWNDSNAT